MTLHQPDPPPREHLARLVLPSGSMLLSLLLSETAITLSAVITICRTLVVDAGIADTRGIINSSKGLDFPQLDLCVAVLELAAVSNPKALAAQKVIVEWRAALPGVMARMRETGPDDWAKILNDHGRKLVPVRREVRELTGVYRTTVSTVNFTLSFEN